MHRSDAPPVKIQDKSIIKVVFESNRRVFRIGIEGIPQVNRSIFRAHHILNVSEHQRLQGRPSGAIKAHSTLSHSPGSVIKTESLPRSIQRIVGWNPIAKFRLRLMINRPAVSEAVGDSSHLLGVCGLKPRLEHPIRIKEPEKLTRNIQPEVGVERLTRFTKILSGSEYRP